MTAPPHDIDAERSVLGGFLISASTTPEMADAMAMLSADSWYRPAHRIVFAAMMRLEDRNEPIDSSTVKAELESTPLFAEAGGLSMLMSLEDAAPTAANIVYHSQIVYSLQLRRQMITCADDARSKAQAGAKPALELVSDAAAVFVEMAIGKQSTDPVPSRVLVREEATAIERRRTSGATGLATGFVEVDDLLGGLDDDDLVVLGARPSMGKTPLALNIAEHVAIKEEIGVAIFSLEMSKEQLIQRMIATNGKVNGMRIKTGELMDHEWPKYVNASARIASAPIWIDDGADLSVMEIRAKCRRLKMSHGIGLVIIDYIQLMSGARSQSRERDVAEITRGLKQLGKELRCPVIALSQLNRGLESRTDKRPLLSDLRESGAIEQDASRILFLYRDDYYNPKSETPGIAEIIVAKNRSGATGKRQLAWDQKYTRFSSMDQPSNS